MKNIFVPIVALCGLALSATIGQAQYPGARFGGGGFGGGQFQRPTVSPYLNLLQAGNPAINYYGLVRPQLAYDKALQNLGGSVSALGSNLSALDASANQAPAQTGHHSSFMTQYSYFMNNGYGGRGGGSQGGGYQAGQAGTQQGAQRGMQGAGQQRAATPNYSGR